MMNIKKSLLLPCGSMLKNRIAKSAMSENMSTGDFQSNNKFETVYEKWALGGCGLSLTGNVMVDRKFLGEARNIVIDKNITDESIEKLKKWAMAGTKNNTHLWMQLNHPGKQSPKFLTKIPVAPSAISLKPPLNNLFNQPRELLENEILDIIKSFSFAAKVAKDAGFTGVQIHGAHGYLVSQFLSPIHNQRVDQWGGHLENRMRFVVEIYKSIRVAVGNNFPISIKLNSADFQKGGFGEDESLIVVQRLSEIGVDLIEISGGSYESPEMTGVTRKKTTIEREAYFSEFCNKLKTQIKTPIMLTGGFRTFAGMESALVNSSCDVIGLGRSLVVNPNFPNELFLGKNIVSEVSQLTTGFKSLDKIFPLEIVWYTKQIHNMGRNKMPNPKASVWGAVIGTIYDIGFQSLKKVRG